MKTIKRILLLWLFVITVALTGALSSACGQQFGSIVINEFLASNNSSLLDPDLSQYADWIELYNKSATAVDFGGCYLTDDLSIPKKWQIPIKIVIQAGQYRLFWADGLNENAWGLHTNFKLNKDGEAIGLFNQDGMPIDTLRYGNQIHHEKGLIIQEILDLGSPLALN